MKNMNNDLISRQAAIEIVERYDKSHMVLKQRPMLGAASIVMELEDLPSVQTEKMQLSEEDATKGTTFDYIDRQAAIDALDALCDRECEYSKQQRSFMCGACRLGSAFDVIDELPSAQPEIIHCNSCKYWTQSTGKMKGYGLGRCDFHDADLVTCNGFCYWAERRNDG